MGFRLGCGRGSGEQETCPGGRLLFGMFHRKEMVEQIGSGFRSMRQEREAGRNGSLSGAETKSATSLNGVGRCSKSRCCVTASLLVLNRNDCHAPQT